MMRTRTWIGFAALTFAGPALADTAPSPAPKPKLIVALAIDQLSTDLFSEYRPMFTGGLKRLSSGVVFPRGHQSHAATETCPGHSTILTGSRPSRTGIIANDWQDPKTPRPGKDGKPAYDIYCAESPQGKAANTMSDGGYVVSSQFLRVPTLGDRMKAADPRARVVSVAGKDRAAVMMGGHKTDLALWWGGKGFATYAGQEAKISPSVAKVSMAATAEIAKPSTPRLPAQCARYSRAVRMNDKFSLGVLGTRKAGDERHWRGTPGLDAATLDAALAAMADMKLGRGEATDVLAIGFSATDYTGHGSGTGGAEMCNQIVALDGILGRLFAALDKSGVPYAVTLTADHGGHDIPERNDLHGLPAAERVDPRLSAKAMGAVIGAKMGLPGSALLGRTLFGDIYLAPDLAQDRRAEALQMAAAAYRSHRQVAAVFTRDEIIASPAPAGAVDEWSLLDRAKASFDAERSGDMIVFLKPYVTPIPDTNAGYFATHGSPWGYDRRVPILFWWKGISGFEQPNAIETVDIMPTLASLIGLPVPAAEIDGRCLDLLAGPESNCGR